MSDRQNDPQEIAKQQRAIETLTRETNAPREIVAELYTIEHVKLERVARVTTFVPLLASRQVKLILRNQNVVDDFNRLH